MSRRFVLVALLLLPGCTDDGDDIVDVGVIDTLPSPRIVAPSSAIAGEPFSVKMTTVGGCITRESTETAQFGHVALITPYDRSARVCVTRELSIVEHEATLTFDEAGDKTLRIFTRHGSEYLQIERAIRVELR